MDPMDVVQRSEEDEQSRQAMDTLSKAFMQHVKTTTSLQDAIEYLSRMHCAILLHNYDPQHWQYLMDTFTKTTLERLTDMLTTRG